MASTLTGKLNVDMSWIWSEPLDLSRISDNYRLSFEQAVANGTGANQANKFWSDTRSILTTANDDLDLTALTNSIFGSTVTISFGTIKLLVIKNKSTTTGDYLKIGAAASNPWAAPFGATNDIAHCGPNSPFIIANFTDGWTVTNSSSDVLRINNPGGNTVSYDIAIFGH